MEVRRLFSLFLLHGVTLFCAVNGDNMTEGEIKFKFVFNPSRHWSVIRLVPSIYTVVFLVALPLNIMAILMFLVKIKVRKPAVVYMLNLATADLLLISTLPFHIVYRFLGSNWIFGEGMCRFVTAAYYCNTGCSVLLLTSISVDRFLAIVYPVRSLSWRTVKRAWLVCGVIWVISVASFVPLLIKKQIYTFPELDMVVCHEYQEYDNFRGFYIIYGITIILIFFYLQLCIITFCYIRIIRSLSSSKFHGTHKRSRAIRLSVVVLSVFVLCFGPTNVIYFIHFVRIYKDADFSLFLAYILCTSISCINCGLDPLIYYFTSSGCQRYVYSLLHRKKNKCKPVKKKMDLQTPEEANKENSF
ncbi:proteinase-activated receptor 1-like [Rana temporaria]|uniref:proteinase-activated receptor 1-like n=1 Tax=Rana temporaria TaxID=8407 RepID=UPI001AADE196|nr:proteinase-activated receptor 1-like [Rana temporaria]